MENALFFRYKPRMTALHKIPGWIKIILILFLAIAAFYLPTTICLALYPVLILLSKIFLGLTFKEIFSDAKPVIAYIILLYLATVLLNLAGHVSQPRPPSENLSEILDGIFRIFIPNLTYLPLLAHLALSLEITSIFYRTTSSSRLKEGFSTIERFLSGKEASPLSDTLALALSFIPRVSALWARLCLAWLSRGGKNSISKALHLFPKLFHAAMREGYEKSLAIQNRSL